jgi:hypothetical protein
MHVVIIRTAGGSGPWLGKASSPPSIWERSVSEGDSDRYAGIEVESLCSVCHSGGLPLYGGSIWKDAKKTS